MKKENLLIVISTENIDRLVKGKIIHYPVIDTKILDVEQKRDLTEFDNIIFTSKKGVEAFIENYGVTSILGKKIVSIGEFTSKKLLG